MAPSHSDHSAALVRQAASVAKALRLPYLSGLAIVLARTSFSNYLDTQKDH